MMHVAIIAWRRPGCLGLTLDSLRRENPDAPLLLWYGLDGGHDPACEHLLQEAGAAPLIRKSEQVGIERMHEDVVCALLQHGVGTAELVLVLEEDWQCMRPIPLDAIRTLFSRKRAIDACWLWGVRKDAQRREDGLQRAQPGRPPIWWRLEWAADEAVLIGQAYWAHPPTIAPLGLAAEILAGQQPGAKKPIAYQRQQSERLGLRVGWFAFDPIFRHTGRIGWKQNGGIR